MNHTVIPYMCLYIFIFIFPFQMSFRIQLSFFKKPFAMLMRAMIKTDTMFWVFITPNSF